VLLRAYFIMAYLGGDNDRRIRKTLLVIALALIDLRGRGRGLSKRIGGYLSAYYSRYKPTKLWGDLQDKAVRVAKIVSIREKTNVKYWRIHLCVVSLVM